MSTNLNSIYSSFMNNASSIQQPSTETNSKGMDSALFATQFENAKKTATYFNETKNYVPETIVTIKSMNAGDIQRYYQGWKKHTIDYLKFKHDIVVSPKVLERMEKDPKYEEEMLLKIEKAATPEGFGDATIYEYKVIVRDDGEIQTLVCADFMNGKNKKTDNNDNKKNDKKKLECSYLHRKRLQTLLEKKIKNTQFIQPQYLFNTRINTEIIGTQYLFHAGIVNKIKNPKKKFKLKHLFPNMLTVKKVQKMNLDMYNLKKSMY